MTFILFFPQDEPQLATIMGNFAYDPTLNRHFSANLGGEVVDNGLDSRNILIGRGDAHNGNGQIPVLNHAKAPCQIGRRIKYGRQIFAVDRLAGG